MSEGKKFDTGKPPLGLISKRALDQIAYVLGYGAKKYGRDNWRNGIEWQRCSDAALRHLTAWNEGDTNDKETGLNHLAHAACEIMFLLEFAETHKELDNRYRPDVVSLCGCGGEACECGEAKPELVVNSDGVRVVPNRHFASPLMAAAITQFNTFDINQPVRVVTKGAHEDKQGTVKGFSTDKYLVDFGSNSESYFSPSELEAV